MDGLMAVNLFTYQTRKSSLVPAGILTAQFLQKTLIYENFVVVGELEWSYSVLLAWRKGKA